MIKTSKFLMAVGSVLFCVVAVPQSNSTAKVIFSKTGNHYYRPDNFNVPATIRKQLNEKRCLVPQDIETKEMNNIVFGEFAQAGQTDWAAYCSINGKSKVVVVWGGSAKCPGEPFGSREPVADDSIYKSADPQQWGKMPPHGAFWKLETIPRAKIVASEKRRILTGKLMASPLHDALQRSSIAGVNGTYCMNGKWKVLWYAD